MALAGSLLGVLAGCGPLQPPQITAVSPAPSQGAVHTDVPIVITFSVPMKASSVERALKIRSRKGSPPPGCAIAVAARGGRTGCSFQWADGGRVMRLLHPRHPLATVTTYTVELAGNIESAAGAVNPLSHSWAFSTEGGPSLSSTFPTSGGTLGPDQAIAVNFDRAMNPESLAGAISLSPAPSGGYTIQPNPTVAGRFLVEPVHPLQPSTTYTLTVTRAALDIDGNHLQARVVTKFTVGRLGSSTAIDFLAGPTANSYTQVLAASPPQVPGDPPTLRVLATAPPGQQFSFALGSPNGKFLATELAGKNAIQVTDLGTGKVSLVLGSTASTGAQWSPDSQQLAFLSGGALRVFTVATDASVTLSALASLQGPLAWRPDSEVLAAVAIPAGSNPRIALLSPTLRAVTYLATSNSSTAAEGNPVWSPSGNSLGFSVGTGPSPAVWLYQPANSTNPLSQLLRNSGQPLAFLSAGTILVRTASAGLASLAITTGTQSVIVGPTRGEYPLAAAVNVSGRQLAYTRSQGGYVQLFLANEDGSGAVALTAFDATDGLQAGPPSFVGG
ncbi:MAG: Ig-like domain-containing protein [Candidatus Dormibacteria bacterium]